VTPRDQLGRGLALVSPVMQHRQAPEDFRLDGMLAALGGGAGSSAVAGERFGDRARPLVGARLLQRLHRATDAHRGRPWRG
jgi:hypothetical protein